MACNLHMPGVFQCGEMEGIKRPRAKHLLNLLELRKMCDLHFLTEESSKMNNVKSEEDSYYLIKLDGAKENNHRNETQEGRVYELYQNAKLNVILKLTIHDKSICLQGNQSEVENNNKLAVTSSIFQNFSFETKQVYRVQQCDKISDEKLETPRNNENGSGESSLNFNYNKMRSKGHSHTLNENINEENEDNNVKNTLFHSGMRYYCSYEVSR